jgi:hypothetical protein
MPDSPDNTACAPAQMRGTLLSKRIMSADLLPMAWSSAWPSRHGRRRLGRHMHWRGEPLKSGSAALLVLHFCADLC